MESFKLKIPASSANMGAGFDSIGLAVQRYLTLDVEPSDAWEFVHQSPSDALPTYTVATDHFIYKVAVHIADKYNQKLSPCKVTMASEIPLARGLGSSAAAVVAGIELTNQICSLNLTNEQKLHEATLLEGHPDNVAPSIFGGCIVSNVSEADQIHHIKIDSMNVDLVIAIPSVELKTEKARQVLPEEIPFQRAVKASSVGNLMIAAFLQEDYALAGKMMERDLLHEPYRARLIPNYKMIRTTARNNGAYGTVISGSGPTMISFVPKGKGTKIANILSEQLPDYTIEETVIDQVGLQINS